MYRLLNHAPEYLVDMVVPVSQSLWHITIFIQHNKATSTYGQRSGPDRFLSPLCKLGINYQLISAKSPPSLHSSDILRHFLFNIAYGHLINC